MNFSAHTIVSVIKKHCPDFDIEHPTRRKYLEHLITTTQFKNIPYDEYVLEEATNRNNYNVKLLETILKMREFIKNKKEKTVLVHENIYQAKYPNDPCFFEKYNKVTRNIKFIRFYPAELNLSNLSQLHDYIILKDDIVYTTHTEKTFCFDPRKNQWSCGKDFIKFE